MEKTIQTLKELSALPALAGFEDTMIEYMKNAFTKYTDDVQVDVFGNVTAVFPGMKPGPSCMVFAHMDELGMIISEVEADGFLRFERVGGLPEKVLPAVPITVRTRGGRWIPGLVAVKSHHATLPDERSKVIPYRELFIDIGAVSAADVEALDVGVGCPATYSGGFMELANGRVAAKSIDNRGGCLALLLLAEILKQNPPQHTVYVVATVQEEFNLRGALVAANRLQPDCAICYDLALTGDTPDMRRHSGVTIGGGPSVGHFSFHGRGTLNGLIPHPKLLALALQTAKDSGLRHQNSVMMGALTDASYVQLVGGGIPALDLQFPLRYTHTPWELVDVNDIVDMAHWTELILRALGPEISFNRG